MNRRGLLASAGMVAGAGAAWNSLLAPFRAVAADAKPIRIKSIETFTIAITATDTEVQAGDVESCAGFIAACGPAPGFLDLNEAFSNPKVSLKSKFDSNAE